MTDVSLDSVRLLHVDDEPDFADMTATFLEQADERFAVETAASAAEGIARLGPDIDCVVSDYDMPGQDGIAFLEQVREEYPDLPFILFTGKGSEEVASDAISAGVTDYLQKEHGTDQYTVLANRISNAVAQYRSQEALETSQKRLSLFIEQSPLGVIEWDDSLEIVRVNDAAEDILGYSAEELVGQSWEQFVPESDRDDVSAVVTDLLDAAGGHHSVNENLRKDGTRITCEWHNRVITDADGDPVTIFSQFQDITERERHERDLERANERIEIALSESNAGIWEVDLDTDTVTSYPTRCPVFDEEIETITDFVDRVHSDDQSRVETAVQTAVETGEPLSIECRTQSDSEVEWIALQVNPIEDDGSVSRVIGLIRDISTQKASERKLNELQRRTQALMHTSTRDETVQVATEAADDVIDAPLSGVHLLTDEGMLEPAAVVDGVHDAFDQLPSYQRDAPAGSRAAIIWNVFDRGEPRRIDDTCEYDSLTESTPARSVIIHPMDDHGVFVISSDEPHAFTDTDEVLVEILATTLTAALDRVEQERARRDRERRLERLHDATVELMGADDQQVVADLVVEEAEDILDFPLVMVRLYDAEKEGLVPVASSDRTDDVLDDRPVFTPDDGSFNWEVFETGEPCLFDDISDHDRAVDAETPLQSLMILPLGEYGTLSAGATESATFDETDVSLAQILATATEATLERVSHLSELEQRRDELQRQNERLEEFASVISHDIRNPLTVLNGAIEMAETTGEQEHFDRCYRAVNRMETMVDDLLMLARQGETIADPEPVDLPAISTSCWRTVGIETGDFHVETDRTIMADRDRFAQLIENLFRNAVEHGGEEVTVTVGDCADGFYVADDGPGVDPAVRDSVFDSGFSTASDNTGFGLAIAERIAEAHGWTITVTDSDANGARFEITGVEMPR